MGPEGMGQLWSIPHESRSSDGPSPPQRLTRPKRSNLGGGEQDAVSGCFLQSTTITVEQQKGIDSSDYPIPC